MSNKDTDIRPATLVDLPLLYRSMDKAILLDSIADCVRDRHDLMGVLLSSNVLRPFGGTHTLIARSDRQQVVGQFRMKSDNSSAHVVFLATTQDGDVDESLWLSLLDSMVQDAGRYEAHMLVAEVYEGSALFETLRTSGFSVYTRQQIWRRPPLPLTHTPSEIALHEATDADMLSVHALLGRTLPSLMQSIPCTPDDAQRWIYKKDNRVEAYFTVSGGKYGVYIVPFINPQVVTSEEVIALIETLLSRLPKSERQTAFIRVRRYQEWMDYALARMGFMPTDITQAVMVRHIAVRNKQHRLAFGMQHALKTILEPIKTNQPLYQTEDCFINIIR
ncbi:MAG: hypothetical protein CUN52_05070 [Phototrophicales bacterium]|nr:MAG: hypothetical protein CUN52_05070 [Phototrophicales bacterium]